MKKATVLIAGATGLVGGECLKILAGDERYERIVVLTRRKIDSPGLGPNVEQHIVDFDRPESYREIAKADIVICTLGTTIKKAGSKQKFRKVDLTYGLDLARIALENGASHFLLVTALNVSSKSPVFYYRVKGELEDAICRLDYEKVTILRPSLLLGERSEFRLVEVMMKPLAPFIFGNVKPIQARTVARAIAELAWREDGGIKVIDSGEMRARYARLG